MNSKLKNINLNDQYATHRLCGELIGLGTYRNVYICKDNPQWVVKVARQRKHNISMVVNGKNYRGNHNNKRAFHNFMEMMYWCENMYYEKVRKWLAPCLSISMDGTIMIQERTFPNPKTPGVKIPTKLPKFLTDIRPEHFGFIGDNFVCHDYAIMIYNLPITLVPRNAKKD